MEKLNVLRRIVIIFNFTKQNFLEIVISGKMSLPLARKWNFIQWANSSASFRGYLNWCSHCHVVCGALIWVGQQGCLNSLLKNILMRISLFAVSEFMEAQHCRQRKLKWGLVPNFSYFTQRRATFRCNHRMSFCGFPKAFRLWFIGWWLVPCVCSFTANAFPQCQTRLSLRFYLVSFWCSNRLHKGHEICWLTTEARTCLRQEQSKATALHESIDAACVQKH